ncbi:winged helix-turn-helix domain-containing protein [Dactylosporangium sp. AC04546]|uniref:winged helix-turn-helix domain-containing protein n=1 Tax=Dactylosporangium sp. AC04546 TaxID=2862460 RepID=UPI001EDFD282|nr:winged helix-turn-helix domain-containing protein [Dactylosporangium sp. AC04546]WVK78586.1 winged helix-turn-helix domain-containing protein [Dactylosporangium sp. AC04546]
MSATNLQPSLGTVLRPRDLALLSPAVLCAEPGSPAARLATRIGRAPWPTVVHEQVTGAVHAASVRDTKLVLVGGNSFAWVRQAVRQLRPVGSFPIALLATEVSADQVLALLDAGANLVIERNATGREVAARLTALCRGSSGDDILRVRWLQAGQLRLDLRARRCLLDQEVIALSHNEFDLLAFLMGRSQQVVPQHEIVQRVWGWRHGDGMNTLRIHVGRLRRKLGDTPAQPRWIGSVRGIGYQFLHPVAELGDDRSDDRMRQAVTVLNAQADALNALVDTLLVARDEASVAETVVQWAITRGFGDAATVFRLDTDAAGRSMSRLVASAGMSARWRQSIATGHPVSADFMGSQVYRSGETVQLHDMSQLARRFPVTARMSSAEDLHACLLFPLHVDGRIWGDLAFVSRTDRAFTPARTAYLRTVAGVVSLAFRAARTSSPTTGPATDA